MGGAPQVAMRVASQIWQIVFASQTLQVFCFCFANPSGFSFGPSQKGTICNNDRDFQNQEEEQDFCSHVQVIPIETK
jgi:hypothetical protein